jgi:hypothetical protein
MIFSLLGFHLTGLLNDVLNIAYYDIKWGYSKFKLFGWI